MDNIVRSHIGWRGEQNTPYKGEQISLYLTRFKTSTLIVISNEQSRQYLPAVGLDYYKYLKAKQQAEMGWIMRSHVG